MAFFMIFDEKFSGEMNANNVVKYMSKANSKEKSVI